MPIGLTRRKVPLGLLGFGVVGESVQNIIDEINGLVGGDLALEVRKVYTRRPEAKKRFSRQPELFTRSAEEVIDDPAIEIIIEALGCEDANELPVFRDYILRAFDKGKSVVTSDKAVLAAFGEEIWRAAGRTGRQLRFEACVGGGIPIVRSLTESFAVEEPQAVFGIVNGTCNYILSQMEKGGKPYSQALAEAQRRGYAETNPAADVSGSDAEAKLLLLTAITFGLQLRPGTTWRKGIDDIHAVDFRYAGRTGASTIKHLAVAQRMEEVVQVFVAPVLISHENILANIDGSTNAICFKGKRSSGTRTGHDADYVLVGPGAGGGPTATAILGDVCDLARGGEGKRSHFSTLTAPGSLKLQPEDQIEGSFYVRFIVKDQAGIVGDIGQTFGSLGVNISEIWQLRHSLDERQQLVQSYGLSAKPEEILPFVITLERATLRQMRTALEQVRNRDYIAVDPVWFPIWGSR